MSSHKHVTLLTLVTVITGDGELREFTNTAVMDIPDADIDRYARMPGWSIVSALPVCPPDCPAQLAKREPTA